MRPMRVLFINSRSDAEQNPGGDNIQMMKTKAALEHLGLAIEIRAPQDLDDLDGFDLAHIFNIQEPGPAWTALQASARKQASFPQSAGPA